MKPNAFVGRAKPPSDADLKAALGVAKTAWDLVTLGMAEDLGLDGREWKSYGSKFGWAFRLKRGKRTIVHLGPCLGSFAVLLILGERAVKAARASRLGLAAMKLLDEAPRYPEGTGIRLQVSRASQVALVRKFARIKLEN